MSQPIVGYVVKCYPRFSETFIVREVLAREAAGEQLAIAALRPPKDPRFHAALALVRAPVTWIPSPARSLAATWEALADLRDRAAGTGGPAPSQEAVTALTDEDPEVAAQAVLLARWALDAGVGHLHAHFASLPARTTRLAALLTGLPWTVTGHAKDLFHDGVDPRRLAGVLTGPYGADAVVAVSDWSARWVAEHHPTAPVRRIHNGLDLSADGELAWSSPRERAPVVAAVGRLVPKKGFLDLLDAVGVLRDRGVDVRLRLAGAGDGLGALEERIAALGIADRVELLGPLAQHEVVALLRTAAVFAAPCVVADDGDRDGLPTVVLEALAVGVPVVSTPVVGVPEAVVDGVTGLLVPERDPVALAGALERLVRSADLREALSVAGRALVEERFDVHRQAAALRELTEVVARRRAPGGAGGSTASTGADGGVGGAARSASLQGVAS